LFILYCTDPFFCGLTVGCGGLGWLILNQQNLQQLVKGITCSDAVATLFSALKAINCRCPVTSIAPCTCQPTGGTTSVPISTKTTLTISCANQGLTDAQMATILNSIPLTTPVDTLDLSWNKLTRVPSATYGRSMSILTSFFNIFKKPTATTSPTSSSSANGTSSSSSTKKTIGLLTRFKQLISVDLSFNSLTSIYTGDLALAAAAVKYLNLASNAITFFEVNSLPSA